MPRNDKTGPAGRGPRTGRGRGSCPSTNNSLIDDISNTPSNAGVPKRDGSGRGVGANYGRGCNSPRGRNRR